MAESAAELIQAQGIARSLGRLEAESGPVTAWQAADQFADTHAASSSLCTVAC